MTTWMTPAVEEAARLIVTVGAVVLVPLAVAAVVKILQRLGLEVEAGQRDRIERIVREAVLSVEEWAAAAARRSNVSVRAGAKLERAVTAILDRVPNISRQEAEALVHAALPALGLGAAEHLARTRQAAETPAPRSS